MTAALLSVQSYRIMKTTTMGTDFNELKTMLVVIIPPASVYLAVGMKKESWLNVLLTLLGYVPGLIHAVFIVIRTL